MARIPRTRLILYILLIGVLALALARTSSEVGSLKPHTPPQQSGLEPVESSRKGSPADYPDSSKAQKTVSPSELDEDDALLELNSLSSEDSAPLAESGQTSATPTALPLKPTAMPASSDDQLIGGARDDKDSRGLFSAAEAPDQNAIGIDGFIGGARSSSGMVGGSGAAAPAATTPTDNGSGWVSGQARGYSMLYAMQPEARAVVESNVATLLSAQVREPYIGVLIDGTFTQDFEYLKTIIRRLSVERNLTLELYLTNGATQRKFETTTIDAPFVSLSPYAFRELILSDSSRQRVFSAIAAQARDLFQFSSQQNPANQNIVSVMLEDNLDVGAYRKMRELASQQLDGAASFMRSTCLRCFSAQDRKSDADTAGDPREEHSVDRFGELKRGDGFSLDGVGFRYPGESTELGVTPEKLKELVSSGYSKGLRFFSLWRHNWQGADASGDNPHPTDRNYLPSTPEQEGFELSILRQGLVVEPVDEEELDSGLMAR